MSDKTIQEILIGIGESVPAEEWARPAITHYADPDTLATLARLERENAALRRDIERHVKIASDLATELEEVKGSYEMLLQGAKAELEAARKDAERWNFVLHHRRYSDALWNAVPNSIFMVERHLNNAIDAAIAQKEGK